MKDSIKNHNKKTQKGMDDIVRLVHCMSPISMDVIVTMLYRFTPTADQVHYVADTLDVLKSKRWLEFCSSSSVVCHKYTLSRLGQEYVSKLSLPTFEQKALIRFKELTKREDVRNDMQSRILSCLHQPQRLTNLVEQTGIEFHVCHMLVRRLERLGIVSIDNDVVKHNPDIIDIQHNTKQDTDVQHYTKQDTIPNTTSTSNTIPNTT